MAALLATYSATGMIMPILTAMIGDEAEDAYWIFHAMGDNVMAAVMGKKSGGDAFLDSFIKFTDLMPNSPLTPLAAASVKMFTDVGIVNLI
jgi:hypothetical protein